MLRTLTALLLAAALAAGSATPSLANIMEPGGLGPSPWKAPISPESSSWQAPTSRFLLPNAPALAPMGFVMFCAKNPSQCQTKAGVSKVWLFDRENRELNKINRLVNHRVKPIHDKGADTWTIATNSGDCEDVALAKRDMLIKSGWPASTLRIAVARTSWGEGHAVLIVGTVEGDFVLDSRFDTIMRWNQTDLTWVKIQSAANPHLWYTV